MVPINCILILQQHLGVSFGENRHGMHRAQRWYDATDKARSYTLVGAIMNFKLHSHFFLKIQISLERKMTFYELSALKALFWINLYQEQANPKV